MLAYKAQQDARSNERRQRAYVLRQSGLTFREVGQELNVSASRARDLVRGFEYLQSKSNDPSEWTDGLDPGTAWMLKNRGYTDAETLRQNIVDRGTDLLFDIHGIGEKRVLEIVEWLDLPDEYKPPTRLQKLDQRIATLEAELESLRAWRLAVLAVSK